LSCLAPILCRCLWHIRKPHERDVPREYGKLEPGGGDVFNPLAGEPTRQIEIIEHRGCDYSEAGEGKGAEALDIGAASGNSNIIATVPETACGDGEDGSEPEDDYVAGGYHPVAAGDIYDGRYEVLYKLGWGVYSTVWCCWDSVARRRVALKIQKAAPEYAAAAANEIAILRHARRAAKARGVAPCIVLLLAHFSVVGPHGTHVCMVFELLGETLLHMLRVRGAFEISEVRLIARRLLEGLAFLHENVGALHTDVKPENILLGPSGCSGAVTLVDLGTAFYVATRCSGMLGEC